MNIRRAVAFVICVVGLLSGGCQSESDKIPATITTNATPKHRRVPGTHVLLAASPDFKLEAQQHMLRLNQLQFVQVLELPGVRFADYQAQVKKQLAAQSDLPAEALQETTFNGHPALFLTQPYRQGLGMEVALLAFGDSSRVAVLLGVYPKMLLGADALTRKILLTAHYDPSLRVREEEMLGYTADMLNTDFRKLLQQGRWTVYSPSGRLGANGDTAHATLFRVATLPPTPERTQIQDVALGIIREYRTAAQVNNVQEANTSINGHYAYQNVLTFNYAGKTGKALVVLVSTPTGVIVFDGRAYEQPDKRIKQFERIAETIRLAAPAS